MIYFGYTLIFLSGLTGLLYQVTWQKYLSILLGSHAAATSIILALFFLFLAFGYLVLGNFASKFKKNPLFLYGVYEFVIGLYALYSPQIFRLFFSIYAESNTQSAAGDYWLGLLLSGAFMFIPTFLMGGTLPALVQGLSANVEVSARRHALIYAVNTLGAFAGCILAGFWLIEKFGLDDTLFIGAWVNLLIGAASFLAMNRIKMSVENEAKVHDENVATFAGDRQALFLLGFVSFTSGFYVFSFEKIIIRLSGMIFGSSTYTYAIVVSAFILAIGLGSLILGLYRKFLSERIFALNLVLSAVSMTTLYFLIPILPNWSLRLRLIFQSSLMNFIPYWLTVLVFSLLLLIIPIGLLGMNLPFLFSLIRNEHKKLARTVGHLYSINCLGSTAGAVIGGYWLFELFRAETVYRIALTLLFVSSILVLLKFIRGFNAKVYGGIILAFLSAAVWTDDGWSDYAFTPGRFVVSYAEPNRENFSSLIPKKENTSIIFSKYDPNTYVTVTQEDEDRAIYVNGKPDAMTSGDHNTRALAVLVPMAMSSRKVEKVFIAGLGAGLSMSLATKFNEVQHVKVAEISKGVVDSLPYFEKFNYELEKRRNKYSIEVGDAYKSLMSSKEMYDLIVCEPSNLWVTGIEKLFSLEFYDIVSKRLHSDGLFAQWFPLFGSDSETFLAILRTYTQKFKYVNVWLAGGGAALTIIGSQSPLEPKYEMIQKRFSEQPEIYKNFGIEHPTRVLYNQALTPAQVQLLLLNVELENSVFAPILEYKAGRAFFAGLSSSITSVLTSKALLPIPREAGVIWPYWNDKTVPFSLEAFKAAVAIDDKAFRLRLYLLNYDKIKGEKFLESQIKDLHNFRYLLEQEKEANFIFLKSALQENNKKISEKDSLKLKKRNLSLEIEDLAVRMRLLMANGFVPKLSRLTNVIEENCAPINNCPQAKLTFLSWFAPPKTWKAEFQDWDAKNLSQEQIARINQEYDSVQNTFKSMGAF